MFSSNVSACVCYVRFMCLCKHLCFKKHCPRSKGRDRAKAYFHILSSGIELALASLSFALFQELQSWGRQIESNYECSWFFVCHPYIYQSTKQILLFLILSKNPILFLQHIKTMSPVVAKAPIWDVLPAFGPCHQARKVAKTVFLFSPKMFYTLCVTVTVTLMPQKFGIIVRICGCRGERIRQT